MKAFCIARKTKVVKKKNSRSLGKDKREAGSVTATASSSKDDSDNNVYGDLDASKTLLLHGLESDFIEEQMAEDADFRYIDKFCWLINAEEQRLSRFWDSFQSVNYRECAAFGEDNNITSRKEVLEQKVTTILGSLNYSRKVRYKVLVIS